VFSLCHEKTVSYVKANGTGESGEKDHRSGQKTAPEERGQSSPCEKGQAIVIADRSKREIEILRRILLAMDGRQLAEVRAKFADQPELFGDDQEAIDMIDWAMKRIEML
jgi:hypothetical protein